MSQIPSIRISRNILSTIWLNEISQGTLLQSKYSNCYNQNIRHGSCLCEICENCVLFAKALNTRLLCPLPTNSHELIARFSCNLQVIVCVMDRCCTCEKEKRNRKREILTKKCKFFPYKVKKPARLEIS